MELIILMGIFYNYLGLRAICEMYSTDYKEMINNGAFLKFIPTQHSVALNSLMHGWFDAKKIETSIVIYINIIFLLIREFRLT